MSVCAIKTMQHLADITGIALADWQVKISWLLCHLIAQSKIIPARSVTGTLRQSVIRNGLLHQITCTGYGWLEREDGVIIDPCLWLLSGTQPAIHVSHNHAEYTCAFCPLTLASAALLPQHLACDEIISLPAGRVRELCRLYLQRQTAVAGLTMAEAACLFSRHIAPEHRLMLLNLLACSATGASLLRVNEIQRNFAIYLPQQPGKSCHTARALKTTVPAAACKKPSLPALLA